MSQPPAALADAREQFLAMVEGIRPELHRYAARLTGSVIEGEDVVQDSLAKAFYALSLAFEVPPLRPWLFRITHNAAVDYLKSRARRNTDLSEDLDDFADPAASPDPVSVRAALTHFVALPLGQRSAVILKDVLGYTLEDCADTMATTVMAVKAALVRGRARLRDAALEDPVTPAQHAELTRYAALFNARDWEGLRALVADDCQLDLVSKSQRRGKSVGMYFARYQAEQITLRVVRLEERVALAAYTPGAARASYFILLEVEAGKIAAIRDYRYVPYIASEAGFDIIAPGSQS